MLNKILYIVTTVLLFSFNSFAGNIYSKVQSSVADAEYTLCKGDINNDYYHITQNQEKVSTMNVGGVMVDVFQNEDGDKMIITHIQDKYGWTVINHKEDNLGPVISDLIISIYNL
ncbi:MULTISPECIES: hypothetical protein [Flammeovirga]|uniref:Uncharacterized protein n=1 Tax=Flammeovirga agarivorans TaxID=2726742 RepID=A0A7X8XZ61_9BACT|nr:MULTISPECIES: hypothetical protein [Flammeovirga]NLR94685.1 hypothetical protein [Flammeovirga agarivorans]